MKKRKKQEKKKIMTCVQPHELMRWSIDERMQITEEEKDEEENERRNKVKKKKKKKKEEEGEEDKIRRKRRRGTRRRTGRSQKRTRKRGRRRGRIRNVCPPHPALTIPRQHLQLADDLIHQKATGSNAGVQWLFSQMENLFTCREEKGGKFMRQKPLSRAETGSAIR